MLSEAMLGYWTSFAQFGDPNKGTSNSPVHWPVYKTASDVSMNLDVPLNTVTGLNKEKCDFWDTVGYYHASKIRHKLGLSAN